MVRHLFVSIPPIAINAPRFTETALLRVSCRLRSHFALRGTSRPLYSYKFEVKPRELARFRTFRFLHQM